MADKIKHGRHKRIKNLSRPHKLHAIIEHADITLDTILNTITDGVTIQDKDYNLIYQNEIIRKTVGNGIGNKCYQVYEGRDDICEECPVQLAFEDGKSHVAERRIVLPSGELIFVENIASPIKDADGEITACVEVTRNITELTRAKQAIRLSEAKYKTLMEHLPQKIFLKDGYSNYISCNEAYADDLEIKPEEIEGKTDYDLFPKELADTYRADDMRVMTSGNAEAMANMYIQHGRMCSTHIIKTPLKDEYGKSIGILGIFWDITEQEMMWEQACATSERYQHCVELTGQLLWNANAVGEIEADIPSWRKYTGQSFVEVKGFGWKKAIHPDDVEHTIRIWEKAKEAKSAYVLGYRLRRYDGVYRHFISRGVPVITKDGSIREWVGTCIDITEWNRKAV
jgi:PAS domain S-box-containing protein